MVLQVYSSSREEPQKNNVVTPNPHPKPHTHYTRNAFGQMFGWVLDRWPDGFGFHKKHSNCCLVLFFPFHFVVRYT